MSISTGSMGGGGHHFNSNSNSALKRFFQIQYGKLKRYIFFQFSFRGVLLFLFLVYLCRRSSFRG